MNKKNITVIAKVTSACNLNCPYCYTRSTIKNGSYMPIETFKKIVQNIVLDYDSAQIIFHGGEPTLMSYEWFEEAISYVKKYEKLYDMNISLAIQTNLTNYNEEKFKLFEDNKVSIGFSYDGMTNSETRKNDETIINNFLTIKDKYKYLSNLGAICLVTTNNYKNLDDDVKLFNMIGIKAKLNIVFNTATMVGDIDKIDLKILKQQYKKLIDDILYSETHPFMGTFLEEFEYASGVKCGLCTNVDCRGKWMSVHPDGNYYPCGQEWRQKNDNYCFGNIETHSFQEAFETLAFKIYSDKIQNKMEKCAEECEIYDFCKGGCPGESFSNNGDVDKKNQERCDFDIEILNYITNIFNTNYDKIKNKDVLNLKKVHCGR